jgi:hypothetical protein
MIQPTVLRLQGLYPRESWPKQRVTVNVSMLSQPLLDFHLLMVCTPGVGKAVTLRPERFNNTWFVAKSNDVYVLRYTTSRSGRPLTGKAFHLKVSRLRLAPPRR